MLSLVSYQNSNQMHPEETSKADKQMIDHLDYKALNFLFLKNILAKLKRKIIFALMCFVMKTIWFI